MVVGIAHIEAKKWYTKRETDKERETERTTSKLERTGSKST